MKTWTWLLALTIAVSNMTSFSQQFDPFGAYLQEFVSALNLPDLPSGTNSTAWTAPEELVLQEKTWIVDDVSNKTPRIDHLYRLTCENGNAIVPFRTYPTLSERNSSRIVGWALGGPSNLPAEELASMFSAETNAAGLVVIEPKNGGTSCDFFVAIFNDAIVRVDTSATNRIELALAILRAGGVGIPGEPEPRDPNPDSEL